jgi:hypothetical protein
MNRKRLIGKSHLNGFIRAAGAVEHSIGGLKRYRILYDRLRLQDYGMCDTVVEVCAGLWNFYLAN